jgi:hypothetical protein
VSRQLGGVVAEDQQIDFAAVARLLDDWFRPFNSADWRTSCR